MATLLELRNLFGDGDLLKKLEAAVAIVANEIATGNDGNAPYDQAAGKHDLRVKWAASAIVNTSTEATDIFKLVLAQNAGATVSQIQNATDTAILTNVRNVVDAIATARYGV